MNIGKSAIAIIASIGFAAASCGNASAQTHFSSRVSFGAHAGVDFSRISFAPSVPQLFKTGMTGGIAIRYIEENHFGLIGECNFVQRGWKEEFDDTPQFSYSRTLNYIEIPVFAHIYFGSSKARFFFNAGPQIDFYISESTSANFNTSDMESIPDFPVVNRSIIQMTMPLRNKIDYGIAGGLGGELQLNRRNSIYIEGRFYYGLGNIFSSNRTDPFSASNSMTISATLGWWFRIK